MPDSIENITTPLVPSPSSALVAKTLKVNHLLVKALNLSAEVAQQVEEEKKKKSEVSLDFEAPEWGVVLRDKIHTFATEEEARTTFSLHKANGAHNGYTPKLIVIVE